MVAAFKVAVYITSIERKTVLICFIYLPKVMETIELMS